jgi:PPOX class probable F420-dependent enzyme
MSRRDQIRMTSEEVDAYLAEPHLCSIGTIGPGGTIHLVAMNYGFIDGCPGFWSYRKSQKTKNLERNSNVTMLVDSGRRYAELKGVQVVGTADVLYDEASVLKLADSMSERYGAIAEDARASAPKRVVVKINVDKIVSWDHGKLGGVY